MHVHREDTAEFELLGVSAHAQPTLTHPVSGAAGHLTSLPTFSFSYRIRMFGVRSTNCICEYHALFIPIVSFCQIKPWSPP